MHEKESNKKPVPKNWNGKKTFLAIMFDLPCTHSPLAHSILEFSRIVWIDARMKQVRR